MREWSWSRVINLDVTGRVSPQEYFYAPDPSSQSICSIGGNVAENSAGPLPEVRIYDTHCWLGSCASRWLVSHFGGKTLDAPATTLREFSLVRGTLGVATKIILRIVKRPSAFEHYSRFPIHQ